MKKLLSFMLTFLLLFTVIPPASVQSMPGKSNAGSARGAEGGKKNYRDRDKDKDRDRDRSRNREDLRDRDKEFSRADHYYTADKPIKDQYDFDRSRDQWDEDLRVEIEVNRGRLKSAIEAVRIAKAAKTKAKMAILAVKREKEVAINAAIDAEIAKTAEAVAVAAEKARAAADKADKIAKAAVAEAAVAEAAAEKATEAAMKAPAEESVSAAGEAVEAGVAALETKEAAIKVQAEAEKAAEAAKKAIAIEATLKEQFKKNRPTYDRDQVEKVWEKAKDANGKVYDPNTGQELIWDKTKSRAGQWDMGHIPGHKYTEWYQKLADGKITLLSFLAWYKNPNNYQPESPSANRSHKYE